MKEPPAFCCAAKFIVLRDRSRYPDDGVHCWRLNRGPVPPGHFFRLEFSTCCSGPSWGRAGLSGRFAMRVLQRDRLRHPAVTVRFLVFCHGGDSARYVIICVIAPPASVRSAFLRPGIEGFHGFFCVANGFVPRFCRRKCYIDNATWRPCSGPRALGELPLFIERLGAPLVAFFQWAAVHYGHSAPPLPGIRACVVLCLRAAGRESF